jgi:hypothetical protein
MAHTIEMNRVTVDADHLARRRCELGINGLSDLLINGSRYKQDQKSDPAPL